MCFVVVVVSLTSSPSKTWFSSSRKRLLIPKLISGSTQVLSVSVRFRRLPHRFFDCGTSAACSGFIPLRHRALYIVGLEVFLLTILHPPPLPSGSVYRRQEMFLKLWPEIQAGNASTVELSSLWRYQRKMKETRPCLIANAYPKPGLKRYLVVDANGGLNQQRSSICNVVVVVGLLNATLVIPRFDLLNVWKDPRHVVNSLIYMTRVIL